jgi:hypothetical protein
MNRPSPVATSVHAGCDERPLPQLTHDQVATA